MRRPLTRRWWFWLLCLWLLAAAIMLMKKWMAIRLFGLGDTDDNMRFLQVRDWLNGQGWFDLRQHRLGPPDGANIHWSRLVDLPIAAIYLLTAPIAGTLRAWQTAIALAPMLAMLTAAAALAVTARRMVGRPWWVLTLVMIVACANTLYMWMPLRIDHHGWQLALLAWTMAGLTDPFPRRGGLTVGFASALSIGIGLEFIHFMGLVAALVTIDWIFAQGSALRLRYHGIALALGSGIMWLAFGSEANRLPVCDALSPVWLLVTIGGGGLMALLSLLESRPVLLRLVAGGAGGGCIAAAFAVLFPHCLGSPEGLTPELKTLWFNNVQEVRSLFTRGWRTVVPTLTIPVLGFAGALMAWYHEPDDRHARRWRSLAILSAVSLLMLLWQLRAAASAQMIGLIGATALGAMSFRRIERSPRMVVRVLGNSALLLVLTGFATHIVIGLVPDKNAAANRAAGKTASGKGARAKPDCQSVRYLKQLSKMPRGLVFTHVDLGPRLIAMTPHSAVAGPYHRNGLAIVDIMKTFRGDPENARKTIRAWKADYVLVCPDMGEASIYRTRAPKGFYSQLMAGKVPEWLTPVALPQPTPYRLWRVTMKEEAENR